MVPLDTNRPREVRIWHRIAFPWKNARFLHVFACVQNLLCFPGAAIYASVGVLLVSEPSQISSQIVGVVNPLTPD